MNDYEKYYTTKLYPMMDGILNILKVSELPFYLTGGTALSRGYFNHRYSDDLDLFLNNSEMFLNYANKLINLIDVRKNELYIEIDRSTIVIRDDYISMMVISNTEKEICLKIDLVNDVAKHFGDFTIHPQFGKIDSLRNILSNKISAIYRLEPKDVVDIWIICKNYNYNWKEIFDEVQQKQIGIDVLEVANILSTVPELYLKKIKWTNQISIIDIKQDLQNISEQMIRRS